MARNVCVAGALAVVMAGCGGPRDVTSVLEDSLAAMGVVGSIEYSGAGMNAFFGQAIVAGQEWPRRDLSSFTGRINYDQESAQNELEFAQPVFGGQRQNTQVNGRTAWSVGARGPVPQPAAAEERQLQIWLTPHGFVKGALAAGDVRMLSEGEGTSVISFTALGRYSVTGTIDDNDLVTQVETKIPNAVLGDMDLVATYADYQAFDGIQFPTAIEIVQGGFPLWELSITRAAANATVDLPVPAEVSSGSSAVTQVQAPSAELADGVWHVTGGAHHSVVVEFDEYLAVVEAPTDEARSLAVLAEARRLAPDKPVRYVLTTHHHFDHTGGLRTYAAQGVTIVTHASNVAYFEQTLTAPATLMPDSQAQAARSPVLEGVSDTYEITDGEQTIQVYATDGDTHTGEYTLVYLPGPQILVEADAWSPGPEDAPPPPTPPANAVDLYDTVESLGLEVSVVAPIHGRGAVPFAELATFIGR
jgi:glyoxylase-like metal-dependent hydrolase (beta-lactamase superfamily II)